MSLPNSAAIFSGPDSGSQLSLLVKASDPTNLDGKLYEMYDHSGNALKVYGIYKLENNNTKVHITYMKDQYGNKAPYDFYNLKYKKDGVYYWSFTKNMYGYGYSNMLLDNNHNIKNNIIKTNPYNNSLNFICIYSYANSENNFGPIIINNYFGNSNTIFLNAAYSTYENIISKICNNIINNNNNINFIEPNDGVGDILIFENNLIGNNNIISNEDDPENNTYIYNNMYIGNDNNINFADNCRNIYELIINSSNNLTLYNDASNVTILNNCDGSINLSDNIIVDNYIDTAANNSSLNTTPNSVYLFKQDVYAKSFNTLK